MRKSLSKKIRFEVFKRDSFTCQYCGKSAPDAVLNVDHLKPVASGGDNNLVNLVTSCFDCNSGKKDRHLDDNAVVRKQIDHLKLLNERKQQLHMMSEWRQSLLEEDEKELSSLQEEINLHLGSGGKEVSENFLRSDIKRSLKMYGRAEVSESIEISACRYLIDPKSCDDRNKFLEMIPRICYWRKRERENPLEAEFRKMAFTANRSWYSCNPHTLAHRLTFLHSKMNVPTDYLYASVRGSKGIMQFEDKIKEFLN